MQSRKNINRMKVRSTINWRKVAYVFVFVVVFFIAVKEFFKCSSTDSIDPSILTLFQKQTKSRKDLLNKLTDEDGFKLLYNVIVPEVYCQDLVRIGQVTDGGKWVCNPNKILNFESCTIYSLGLNNDPSFDEDFQKFLHNKCQLRTFDKDDQTPETMKRLEKANGTFMKALIANVTDVTHYQYTFKDTVRMLNDKRIDILKIDIEGNEFQIADEIISIPICQLLIEVHNESPKKTLDLLKKFASSGLYLFSYEINGQEHTLSEYSFIHESCLKDYNVNVIYGRYLV